MTKEAYDLTQFVCTIVQAVSAVAAVIATAWIAAIVDRSARLLAKWEHERAVRDSWSNIDAVALGNPELLRVADGLLHPPTPQMTDAERQKRWFGYMLCNVLESSLFANKLGVSRFVVAKWIQNGNLPDAYVEKVRAIRESEVIRED